MFDDGSGPALYAGGEFTSAGGVAANYIAKWNGSSWSALGSGMNGIVYALTVFDDGSGPALYAGGVFTIAGGVAANHIAKWNGSSWSALGSGMGYTVYALTVFDDGSGPALYAGGDFTTAGGVAANRIAKWNGSSWSALSSGMDNSVFALTVFDDGSGAALYAGGSFRVSPAGDSYLAKWGNPPGCGTPGISICEPGVGGVIACPCGNAPAGSGLGCDNSSNTGGAQLTATGIARLSFDTVVFTTNGEEADGDEHRAAGRQPVLDRRRLRPRCALRRGQSEAHVREERFRRLDHRAAGDGSPRARTLGGAGRYDRARNASLLRRLLPRPDRARRLLGIEHVQHHAAVGRALGALSMSGRVEPS